MEEPYGWKWTSCLHPDDIGVLLEVARINPHGNSIRVEAVPFQTGVPQSTDVRCQVAHSPVRALDVAGSNRAKRSDLLRCDEQTCFPAIEQRVCKDTPSEGFKGSQKLTDVVFHRQFGMDLRPVVGWADKGQKKRGVPLHLNVGPES
jgi:hypothetical protein